MFALLSKLAEIFATFGTRFLDSRDVARDTAVAGHLVGIVVAIQDVCWRGRRILGVADGFADGTAGDRHAAELDVLLTEQERALTALQNRLLASRELLATIDARLYLELAPLLDDKSGLLTRWSQQVEQSRFSTTTLFFVPAESLQRLLEIGAAYSSQRGLDGGRDDYVLALADQLRAIRSREGRDIRRATEQGRRRLTAEIATARAELSRAEEQCANLLVAAERALGPTAFAALRRKLVPRRRLP